MRKKAEKPSDELLKLIELANLAPIKPKPLPNFDTVAAKIYFEQTGKGFPKGAEYSWREDLDGSFEGLYDVIGPTVEEIRIYRDCEKKALGEIQRTAKKYPALYRYVFLQTEETLGAFGLPKKTIAPTPEQQINRYKLVLSTQDMLLRIAITCSQFVNRLGIEKFNQINIPIETARLPPINAEKIYFNHGKIAFTGLDVRKTLSDCDARRIRRCNVCKLIFWANRLDAKFCSKKCGNLHRVKEHQKKKAEKEKALENSRLERQKWLNKNFSDKESE